MLFWIWLRPRYKIQEFFTIAHVLTSTLAVCRRNRGEPSSGLRVRYKYYKNSRFGLAWSRPRADRGLSRLTRLVYSVNNRCMQSFIHIG